MRRFIFLLIQSLLCLSQAIAQSPNGTINGIVLDPSGAAIAGAEVVVVNDATGVQYTTKTNGEGIYVVPNLPPGSYRIQVSNSGFKTIIKPDIVIHVLDALAINFTLPIGAASEIVTVKGGSPLVNTENAAVGTVVDRKYVENMALNGRSFQDLILLTPGLVTNSPQGQQATSIGHSGEFSVNGQRTESNYYVVDGISANTGISPGDVGSGNSGSVAAATALGTTQALVSIDALQEFRVQSSSYSAEYGRNPGGQFSFVTRSGTNQWHGTTFEYLRNNYFDANNWFNDFFEQPEPPLRQNDFGGTFSGPIELSRLYDGKNRTFFFFSYEGLRLLQPQPSTQSQVPDAYLRTCAAPSLRKVWNAFPQPTAASTTPDCTEADLTNGLADFVGTWSNPAALDAYSVRIDHYFTDRLKLFFRFADTPSSATTRLLDNVGLGGTPSVEQPFRTTSRAYTFGTTSVLSPRVSNEMRFGYSSTVAHVSDLIDDFGGAVPINLAQLQQLSDSSQGYSVQVKLFSGSFSPAAIQGLSSGSQSQWSLTDSLTVLLGRQQFKFGVDYRRLTPIQGRNFPQLDYFFFSASEATANAPSFTLGFNGPAAHPLYTNFSTFVQDEWKLTTRLNVSMGLRWEVNPAPSVTQGLKPYTVQGAANFATMTLAPQGTALWSTTWSNLAPRLGVAYVARQAQGDETVIRMGGGLFFDTGQQLGSEGFSGVGLDNSTLLSGSSAAFPILRSSVPPAIQTPVVPYGTVYAYPHLELPYTVQWNAAVEQALGLSQSVSLTYVGSHAGRLLENDQVSVKPFNPNFTTVEFFRNGLTADYDAFQAQFKRTLSHGLTALASYTWSHAIDDGSYNFAFPYERGNSDYDVRHSFSSAFSYDLPSTFQNRFVRVLLSHWGLDDRFTARTGFPVTLQGTTVVNPATGQSFNGGLNLIAGVPLYLSGAQYPGGRSINPAAFSKPASGSTGDAPRNFVRGIGAWQMNTSVRRDFPVKERLKLQFRAESFNIFNHPNFGMIDPNYGSATFGQAISTLNASLGGLNSLYQTGGPRSIQLSLRLTF
ncbi:MAG TPA: TonB-dependent receptor [Terriglobales bacterium]|nr:TonB-dependent receptor [Terriglobales bacterium]